MGKTCPPQDDPMVTPRSLATPVRGSCQHFNYALRLRSVELSQCTDKITPPLSRVITEATNAGRRGKVFCRQSNASSPMAILTALLGAWNLFRLRLE